MINITLKDNTIKKYEKGITIYEIAKDISEGLARNTLAGIVDGKLCDVRVNLEVDCGLSLVTFDDEQGKKAFRNTGAMILLCAVKRLFPYTKVATEHTNENGFYFDFDREAFTSIEIIEIEKEMKKIVKENLSIERTEISKIDAIKLMEQKDELYQIDIINEYTSDNVIIYKLAEFVYAQDMPMMLSTKNVKAIKILNDTGSSGAYWKGDEGNKMLSRLYATAFNKASLLDEYMQQIEEAKKRDHNKLGRELGLFTTSDTVGQGLPLLMPKGAKIIQTLQRFVEDEEEKRGYSLTKTPLMGKADLYKISGHWQHYRDGMFIIGDENNEDEALALRPMTCPFQYTIYNAEQHSYRELPIRYAETSTLFRKEASGEMHGIIRVRQFTISEGHIVCTKEQLGDEFAGVVDLINFMMNTLGIQNDVSYRFSKWDSNKKDKYEGTKEQWEETQDIMRGLLNKSGLVFTEAEGEAAFYGPKLDIQFKNVHGKEDTIITVQIDFLQAKQFDMSYVDKNGSKNTPIIIHRTSLGCYERTLAMLIEKYAGNFPTWLAPIQAIVLPISEKYHNYAEIVIKKLKNNGIRTNVDYRAEKIGYKIREARLQRIPFLLVVGEKEAEMGQVSIKSRGEDLGAKSVDKFLQFINEEINNKTIKGIN